LFEPQNTGIATPSSGSAFGQLVRRKKQTGKWGLMETRLQQKPVVQLTGQEDGN
jgi:hypothetical protein